MAGKPITHGELCNLPGISSKERRREDKYGLRLLVPDGAEDYIDLVNGVGPVDQEGGATGCGSFLNGRKLVWPRGRVPQNSDLGQPRNNLIQKLEAFGADLSQIQKHACDIASRLSQAFRQAAGNWIGLKVNSDNRDRRGGFPSGPHTGRADRNDHIHPHDSEFTRIGRQLVQIAV
jgi:hypothetical protein